MGVTYKLKPEIKDFLLQKKKEDPHLSCRVLVEVVFTKFQVRLSKSSINALLKDENLSLSIGRRTKNAPKPQEIPLEAEVAPAQQIALIPTEIKEIVPTPVEEIKEIPKEVPPKAEPQISAPAAAPIEAEAIPAGMYLLLAADSLLGASNYILEAIRKRLATPQKEPLTQLQNVLYSALFGHYSEWTLSYLDNLQGVKGLSLDLAQILSSYFQEVRCLKITLSDETTFYLDGQLHTIWSTPQIPYDFSGTLSNLKGLLSEIVQKNSPFVLLMAPGYETPTKEFFDFISSLQSDEKTISRVSLYGNNFEELSNILINQIYQRFFILGMWPWQFANFRRVKISTDYKQMLFAPLNKAFYYAPAEVVLLQPNTNKNVMLSGLAIKTSLVEKVRLLVLTNLAPHSNPEEILKMYLGQWMNLDEAFSDYSRKIELFTYTATSRRFFSTENVDFNKAGLDIKSLFQAYLETLDLYVRWHFLPAGYEEKDLAFSKESFYSLGGKVEEAGEYLSVQLEPPAGYSLMKDLSYALRRINERQIMLGKRFLVLR